MLQLISSDVIKLFAPRKKHFKPTFTDVVAVASL